MKKLTVLLLALLAGLALIPLVAEAQARSVTMPRRDAEISILPNGDVQFVETWVVQFSGGPFQQAFRVIPTDQTTGITDIAISEGTTAYRQTTGSGTPNTYSVTDDGGEVRIQWYFPATTNATRTWTLRYTVRGSLSIYPAGDQFYWKFVESDRQYTIQASRVRLTLPGETSPDQIRATTYTNVRETGGAEVLDGRTVEFTGGPFPSGVEWELRAQFPSGLVNASPAPWQVDRDREPIYTLIGLFFALVIAIAGPVGVVLLWYLRGRDERPGMVAEFLATPPDDLRPGVAGVLLDERADLQDIIATLVDLARRGSLQIIERDDNGANRFRFVRQGGDTAALLPYERLLLESIFGNDTDKDLRELRNKFYLHIPSLQTALTRAAVDAGLFPRSPAATRAIYAGLGTLVLLSGIGAFVLAVASSSALISRIIGFPSVPVMLTGLVLILFSPAMPRRTAKGSQAAAKWRAFRRYLEHIDRYTNVAEAKDQFERYLPYAIAFGLERRWVDRFAQAGAPAPTWYLPYPVYRSGGWESYRRTSGDWTGGWTGGAGDGGRGGLPSLDSAAARSLGGLNAMSAGFFSMLNSTSSVFTSAPRASSSGGGGGWSGGGGGGGRGGGGGSSGFG